MALRDAVILQLSWVEKLAGNFQLLLVGVTGKLDNLHAVRKGRRDGIEQIGRANKEHVGEIKRQIQVMITEGVVLLRIQHFQEGRRWISTEIGSHLVDLIEHKDRIVGTSLFDSLNDPARQGSDIGPPVSANLCFITDPSKGNLAGSWGPDEAENRALNLAPEFIDGQVLQDPLLDLL